ncbi:TiaS agmantine-binding domain-containing protein [Methanobacterium oryzae]|uniref:TiaS agmantine-binding domain-containing protein n=1 Tax=Methanobacterium oryzae TaxID=69540 RepID=UPI003D1DF42B
MYLYIGIDDTDSKDGMCTTYICSVIIDELKYFGFEVIGYPRLIRLNPFARFKTRGNGALSFKLNLESKNYVKKVKEIVLKKVEKLSELEDDRTNPGVVFYCGEITEELKSYSLNVIRNIIKIEDAERFADKIGAEYYKFKKGRGIIGALAAIGCPDDDKTYELLTYRLPENYGKNRKIDYESVFEMNRATYPETFDNVDADNSYIAIEPHTPCPILYGIRGESPEAVKEAKKIVKVCEQIEKYAIFETNQHTDMHLVKADKINDLVQFKCYIVEGEVKDFPYTREGGHVIFILKDDTGEIPCAAYEPTKEFRDIARKLAPGDKLHVYGGIGEKGTLNIEKFEILELAKIYKTKNPLCECGKRMKSAGSGKGYKCVKCGVKLREGIKDAIEIKRDIEKGFYEVPPSARRHLSKPLIRS